MSDIGMLKARAYRAKEQTCLADFNELATPLIDDLLAALAAETARADMEAETSEHRRKTLMAKSDELRAEWIRAENEAAKARTARAECDRLRTLLHASGTGYAETRDR